MKIRDWLGKNNKLVLHGWLIVKATRRYAQPAGHSRPGLQQTLLGNLETAIDTIAHNNDEGLAALFERVVDSVYKGDEAAAIRSLERYRGGKTSDYTVTGKSAKNGEFLYVAEDAESFQDAASRVLPVLNQKRVQGSPWRIYANNFAGGYMLIVAAGISDEEARLDWELANRDGELPRRNYFVEVDDIIPGYISIH